MRFLVTGLLLGSLLLSATAYAQESGKPFVTLGTGGVTGVYYAAGHAVAKVFGRTAEERNFRLDAEASQGSVENINKVLEGEFDFGIAQADMLYKAEKGLGPWNGAPQPALRAVAALYPEALTIVTAEDAGIFSVTDLRGKKISIGAPGSSDEQNALKVLTFFKLDPSADVTLIRESAIEAPEDLQKGYIDAYFYTVGHPNLSLREATHGSRKIRLLEVAPELLQDVAGQRGHLSVVNIPVDYYPELGNKSPVPALAVKAVLFTRAATPDSQVAPILQALLDDFGRFQRQHPAFAGLSRTDLPRGVILPLHPAAETIYRKEGLK